MVASEIAGLLGGDSDGGVSEEDVVTEMPPQHEFRNFLSGRPLPIQE